MSDKKARLLWRCRRGIKEMDIILQEFINLSYDQLNDIISIIKTSRNIS